jgi:hypothetical protein
MIWEILANVVMVFHLLLEGFFIVSAILLAIGVFDGRRNWQIFYWGGIVVVLGLWLASVTKVLKSCSITDLEYMLRRKYDPSWTRTGSLLGTFIFNLTGIKVPEIVFTVSVPLALAVMIISLIVRRHRTISS